MQSPSSPEEDPSGGFTQGGWAAPYWEETMPQVMRTAMSQPYDIIFGRKTYDLFAGHWPNAPKSDIGDMLNEAKKHVVTSSSDALSWNNSHPISGDIVGKIAALKADDGPFLQVHGSSRLIQTLHGADLVDEYRLWTFPVVLGTGKRLFEQSADPRTMTLARTESLGNGVLSQVYRTG